MTTHQQLLTALSGHIGRERGITARHLCARLNVSERQVRALISEARENGYGVCGTPRDGYYIAANAEELEETCQFLRHRALHSLTLESVLRKIPLVDLLGQLRPPHLKGHPMTTTLAQIRAAAEILANAHNDTSGCAALLQAEIKSAIAPILENYKTTLDGYAAKEADAFKNLEQLLIVAPQLFKKPRSLSVDGVRCGYLKAADTLDWTDDAAVIARIKALKEDLAPILIRTQESLVVDALSGIKAEDLVSFGVRTITGADNIFITVGDNDAEKLTKLVIAAAASRQGEEDKPKAAKGKAKVGKAAGMSYTPLPGSKAEAIINYIRKKGSGRSGDIAQAVDIEQKNIPGTLKAAVDNGALVVCDVEIPGKPSQKEYRIGGGMAPLLLSRPELSVGAGKKLLHAVEERPAAAALPPAVKQISIDKPPAKQRKRLPPGTLRSEILDSLNAGVPMSSMQIATARLRKRGKISDAMAGLVEEGLVKFVKSGRTRAYFLTPKGVVAAGKTSEAPAPVPQAKPEKPQQKAAPIVTQQALVAPSTPFRCGIFSDGALRLDGDFPIDAGGIVIAPAQTRVLVDYLRKLGELEAA